MSDRLPRLPALVSALMSAAGLLATEVPVWDTGDHNSTSRTTPGGAGNAVIRGPRPSVYVGGLNVMLGLLAYPEPPTPATVSTPFGRVR